MDDQFLATDGDWIDETAGEEQRLNPDADWIDGEPGGGPPPGPAGRRRPVIIGAG